VVEPFVNVIWGIVNSASEAMKFQAPFAVGPLIFHGCSSGLDPSTPEVSDHLFVYQQWASGFHAVKAISGEAPESRDLE
jgi:hypothetical protein